MRIAIIGQYSIPPDVNLASVLRPEDRLQRTALHPHPWIYTLAEALARIPGNEVHLLIMTGHVKADRTFAHKGVTYHILRSASLVSKLLTGFRSNNWKMHRLLDEIQPDVVHGQSRGRESYYAVSSRYPHVVTNHGSVGDYAKTSRNKWSAAYIVNRWREHKVDKRTRYYIGVSQQCVDRCLRMLPPEKVALIENAVTLSYFRASAAKSDGKSFLFVGSLTPRKQVLELIRAIGEGPDACLRIIFHAAFPEYLAQLKEYVNSHALRDRIHLLGFKTSTEIVEELGRSVAVCLPSKYETFGLVLAEAMAAGRPVIASRINGLTLVKDGYNGLLFEPGNVAELADKIRFLILHPQEARAMGENGRKLANERWHPDLIARRTLEVYFRVLAA